MAERQRVSRLNNFMKAYLDLSQLFYIFTVFSDNSYQTITFHVAPTK